MTLALTSCSPYTVSSEIVSQQVSSSAPPTKSSDVSDDPSSKADGYEEIELITNYLNLYADGTHGYFGPFEGSTNFFLGSDSEEYIKQKQCYEDTIKSGIELDIDILHSIWASESGDSSSVELKLLISEVKNEESNSYEITILAQFDFEDGFPYIKSMEIVDTDNYAHRDGFSVSSPPPFPAIN